MIRKIYKGQEFIVTKDGGHYSWNGASYLTLSAVATAIGQQFGRRRCSGSSFFRNSMVGNAMTAIPKFTPDTPSQKSSVRHRQFPLLLDLIAARQHVYLWGAPGGGKSTAAQQAAESLGLTFGYISLDEQSADYLLMGYKDAVGNYHRTSFRDRYENGGVFVIEEMDNASGSLLTSLGLIEDAAKIEETLKQLKLK